MAYIDVVVFRYEKGCLNNSKKTLLNGKEVFCNVKNGVITFNESAISGSTIADDFNVYVGLVSGKDEVYKVPFGNIELLKDKDQYETSFIFLETFPSQDSQINNHLISHRDDLMERRIKKFTENNWFEWGAPRNISSIRKFWGRPCIYIRNLTRKKTVAFTGRVCFFGGTLICLIPKKREIEDRLDRLVEYFNSTSFQKDYVYAGRFKIGHKQLSMAIIPQ